MAVSSPVPKLSSAAGIINLLNEKQIEVKCHAVRQLNSIVDFFWPEIADIANKLEHLAGDATFPDHGLAALVLSKVYFHMEKWDDSIRLALMSGPLFDITLKAEYNRTILAKAVDCYVVDRAHNYAHPTSIHIIDPALEAVVERMIGTCLAQGDYKQVVGLGVDACRLDVLQAALKAAVPAIDHLKYAEEAVSKHSRSLEFQRQALELLVALAESQEHLDYVFICNCLVSSNDVPKCAQYLVSLLKNSTVPSMEGGDELILALQIAFNIYEIGSEFAQKVYQQALPAVQSLYPTWTGSNGEHFCSVLSGRVPSDLCVRFLAKANHADLLILERSRESLNLHNSMHHTGIYYANGLMHAGSTNDEFLRKNMEWLSYASNWAKFSAAASLGMIHQGHWKDSRTVLAPYLPKPGTPGSPYAEGGALFALGLIHAKAVCADEISYLRIQLAGTTDEVVQHGACLGLGAAAMATHDSELLDDLRGILYGDNAVAGEAAALAIGLVMAGSVDESLSDELLQYARETQHEKIIRAISLAVALIHYGARDRAATILHSLIDDKDALIRFGAVWTVAMAYVGTSDNSAIRRLLHAAVSESDDDVRRAAVTALGFVLCKSPGELPQLLGLLAGSYNPHVRYGVAMALGIAFCGTGSPEALELVKPLCKDFTDFVRQGAYLALSLILQQVSEAQSPEVAPARRVFETVATSKHEDALARFGALLAQGLIDAGGRNSTLSLTTPANGHPVLARVCCTMLFCQFWYWYPAIGFLPLALQPTGMLAVDGSLRPPVDVAFASAAPPKLFAYPEPTKTTTIAAPKRQMASVVLSTTAKAAARARRLHSVEMTDIGGAEASEPASPDPNAAAENVDEMAEPEEPLSAIQGNLTRITRLQRPHIIFGPDLRYSPLQLNEAGVWAPTTITVVKDNQPGQPAVYLDDPPAAEPAPTTAATTNEAATPSQGPQDVEMAQAPEPFEEPDI